MKKLKKGEIEPLGKNLVTAYSFYKTPSLKPDEAERPFHRGDSMPPYTTVTGEFTGIIDHIFYNTKSVKLLELLEIPDDIDEEQAMPSLKFPSDHFRLEAKFLLPK